MEGLSFSQDREQVDLSLFRNNAPLTEIIRNINMSTPIVCKKEDAVVAQCLVQQKGELYDIVNYVATDLEYGKETLLYVMDYFRALGARYIEIGCGNAHIDYFTMFQHCGFRVIEVIPNYYVDENKSVTVENLIINRDLLRFRVDLNEKMLSTTGFDASGRT